MRKGSKAVVTSRRAFLTTNRCVMYVIPVFGKPAQMDQRKKRLPKKIDGTTAVKAFEAGTETQVAAEFTLKFEQP